MKPRPCEKHNSTRCDERPCPPAPTPLAKLRRAAIDAHVAYLDAVADRRGRSAANVEYCAAHEAGTAYIAARRAALAADADLEPELRASLADVQKRKSR